MSIAFRKYIRVVLVIVLAFLVLRRYAVMSPTRLIVAGVGVIALAAIVYLMANALRKSRKERDEVPKNPLGLE